MKLLDLYCKAGGAAMGYYRAGFTEIVGVDLEPQSRYPFTFIQADVLNLPFDLSGFDAIHASPPCQFASICTPPQHRTKHSNLIPQTRAILKATGLPYVIENVANARNHLINPLMLCGSMFGLGVWRHRYFEIEPQVFSLLPPCNHAGYPVLITGTTRRAERNGGRFEYGVQQCRDASGIQWMSRKELDQAIPPAYTEFIGRQMLACMAYYRT